MKIKSRHGSVVAYGTPLDSGYWSGDCYLDGGKSDAAAGQTE
ncbi:MAG: hypothetical protein ACREFE_12165 [Limisphaerales bacterium]